MTDALIRVTDLTIRFTSEEESKPVVDGVSFDIHRGQCLGLVGESGSGKTLTALSILQLLPQGAFVSQQSHVWMGGKDVLSDTQKQIRQLRGATIAVVFQDAITALNPVKTIGWQIHEVLRLHQPAPRAQRRQRIEQLLQEVGIGDVKRCYSAYPHELSGGMRQRAMIAMALACEPDCLILDEPTTALDVTVQSQVIDLLKQLQLKHNMAMLFISHDLAVVSQLADHMVVLRHGKVMEQCDAVTFFQTPSHPYSQQLLASLPSMSPKDEVLDEHVPSILTVDQLKVYFPIKKGIFKRTVGHVKAVDQVSFSVKSGRTLAIVGESGSGKTTTAKALVQLLSLTGGDIVAQGKSMKHWSARERHQWRHQIQMIYQDPYAALNPRMRVFDSMIEGIKAQQRGNKRSALIQQVDEWLEQVQLPLDAKWCFPHEFSGGERQRICIARALMLRPACLVLDEPTSALDVSIQTHLLQLLMSLQEHHELSYILITHNIAVVATMAHDVMVMHQGRTVEQGLAAHVLQHPEQAYTQQLMQAVPHIAIPGGGT